jgi:hypothetical protein
VGGLSALDSTLVAFASLAVICGAGFVVWRTMQMSRTFAAIDRRLDTVASSLQTLADLRMKEWEDSIASRSHAIPGAAVNIVFDHSDVFNASPGEAGVGVFTLRNVGPDAAFLLGVTRTPDEAPPQGPVRLLVPGGERNLNLRLDPGQPRLDEDKVTVWYRDLRGRPWRRSFGDVQATLLPDPPAVEPAATGPAVEQGAETQPGSARAVEALSAASPDGLPETDGRS